MCTVRCGASITDIIEVDPESQQRDWFESEPGLGGVGCENLTGGSLFVFFFVFNLDSWKYVGFGAVDELFGINWFCMDDRAYAELYVFEKCQYSRGLTNELLMESILS